ncbi:MAG: DUF4440 domain-containing protein [Planctomycetes bacterium]|nr:DUF4440 domain-containing protein [Planctomycetota bacterium]
MTNIGIRILLASVFAQLALAPDAIAQPRRNPPKPAPGAPAQSKPAPAASEAEQAIRKAADDYAKAFNARDFDAIGKQWTEMAELHQDSGATVRGRDSIVGIIRKAAAHRPKAAISIKVESVDMLGAGAARVRGTLVLKDEGEIGVWATRFSSLRVLEGGQWRLADSRETAISTASIEEMAWLVGSWSAESPLGKVTVSYEKALGDRGLVGKISVKPAEGPGMEVLEVIQVRDGEIRSWVFDSTGLSGEGYWEHDGARFNRTIHGVTEDGRPASSVIVLTRVSPETALWHPIERIRGDVRMPDLPSIKLTKSK